MTAELDWVLERFGTVVGSITAPLKRVNRDESEILEDDIRSRTGELQESNFVGATFADRDPVPIGTEYDHDVMAVVGVRIEGLHYSKWGHIDPDGVEGIDFDELVRRLRDSLLDERKFPDVGSPDGTYTDLRITNEEPQSSNWEDYYRYDFDCVFNGFEDID